MLTSAQLQSFVDTVAGEAGDHEENGANRGSCNKYQLAGGGVPGDSWCMDLLLWALHEVTGRYPLHRTGSCEEQRRIARQHGALSTEPGFGRIGLVVDRVANHAHHAFVVSSIPDEYGTYDSWAGNTNDDGSSNGTGVYEKTRGAGDGLSYSYIIV